MFEDLCSVYVDILICGYRTLHVESSDPRLVTTANTQGTSTIAGALNLIQSGAYLQTASQIGAAEAYHASMIRSLLFQNISTIAAYGFDIGQITSAIVRTINSLAGPPQLQFPIADVYGSSIANVDSNGELAVAM